MGWPLAWGVFQTHFKRHVFPETSDTVLSLLGTLQNMIFSFTAFVSGKMGDRFGYKRFIAFGSVCSVAGLLGAAFSTKLWHFFITMGLLPGLAMGLAYPMIASYPSQWFKRKRALATGIVVAGSPLGGGVSSLIVREMLNHMSLRSTLLIHAGVNGALLVIGILLLKTRGPKKQVEIRWVDTTLFKDPVFWSVGGPMLLCTFGFLPPVVFVGTYTTEKIPNIGSTLSVAPAAILDFTMVLGRIGIGFVADRIGVTNAVIISCTLAAASQMVFWNVAQSFTAVVVFSVFQGALGGCFVSLNTPVCAQLFGTDRLATLTGVLILFNAPGNLGGAPLFGAILEATKRNWHASISVSGAFHLLGAVSIMYARFKRQPKLLSVY